MLQGSQFFFLTQTILFRKRFFVWGRSEAIRGSIGWNNENTTFFSRRIGLDDFGNPIPLDAGGRFVYRSSKRNAGVIAMRQRGSSTTPGTNFFVGRFSENFGKQNRIGGLMTVKNNSNRTNVVSAIDGFSEWVNHIH